MKKIFLISCALIVHEIYFNTLTASSNPNSLRSTFAQLQSQLIMPCDDEIKAITNIDRMHELEYTLQSHYDKINELFQLNANDAFSNESEYYKAIDIKSKLFGKALIIYQQLELLEQENKQDKNQKQS